VLRGILAVRRARIPELLLCVAALGALIVLGVRVESWSNCWRFSITEGREAPAIYGIWRVLHGHALYEWPNQPPFSLTLYNFGFYRAYAAVFGFFGVDGEGLLRAPRLLTALGGVVGAVVFVDVAARLRRPQDALGWTALIGLSFAIWFGTQFASWWSFSVRPDLWAAALALLALRFGLSALLVRRVRPLVIASLLFYVAWSFKQSTVWMFAGLVLAFGFRRDLRSAVLLAAPCASLMLATLALGSDEYRFNLLTAPAASAFSSALLLNVLARAVPQNCWVFAGYLAVLAAGTGPLRARLRALAPERRALTVVALVGVTFGVAALGREGSNKNHLFEGYVASALVSWAALGELGGTGAVRRWRLAAVLTLLIPFAVFPWAQLARPNALGRTVLCTPDDGAELARLAEAVARLPKPLYSDDEIMSLPWHSTDGRYPALVLDGTWYGIARREGLLAQEFPYDLLGSGRFRSALFPAEHPHLRGLEERGTRCELLGPSPFGMRFAACALERP
jgi:hypothetical protein